MKLPSGRSVGRAPVVAAWSFVTCAAIACGQVTVAGNSSGGGHDAGAHPSDATFTRHDSRAPDAYLAHDAGGDAPSTAISPPPLLCDSSVPDASPPAQSPVVLVTDANPITSFAIDATHIYWSTGVSLAGNGQISKCPIGGCAGSPTILATQQLNPQGLVVSGGSLYWADDNAVTLMTCGVDCQDDATVVYNFDASTVRAFAIQGSEAFFFGDPTTDAPILECSTSGCAIPATFASAQAYPSYMAATDAGLYWTNFGAQLAPSGVWVDGGVLTCPLEGCDGGPKVLAGNLSDPAYLVVNGGVAFWADSGFTSVLACSVAGCGGIPTLIATLPSMSLGSDVSALAVDATDVYVCTIGSNMEILRSPRGGCPSRTTVLYSTSYKPDPQLSQAIAVDATHVYFLSANATQILALPK